MSMDSNPPLDPRVQVELEKLNSATDNINKFEVELDEAKSDFKKIVIESVDRIKQSAHKLGNSIQTAKPYYEARLYAAQLAKDTQQAAVNYEKARSIHSAAKEMVYLAEQGLGEKSTLDTACQEMLSHAASRVNQSQVECTDMRNMLKICELKQEVANNRVTKLQAQLKSAIRSSSYDIRRSLLMINILVNQHQLLNLPYYETRANYNGVLKTQKIKIEDLERKVSDAKMTYNEALKNLEQISEEIHKMRQEKKQREEIFNSSFHSNLIDTPDEYLDIPAKLTLKSSPVRQGNPAKGNCPHLLRDVACRETLNFDCVHKSPLQGSCNYDEATSIASPAGVAQYDATNDIEQWTEIRLSNSESSSSGYSHNSTQDDRTPNESDTSSSDNGKKITCTVFGQDDEKKSKDNEASSNWITRSSLKDSGRRQSLDMLIDASDKVKDVFTLGFQRVGKTLERRNSESEVSQTESNDFFLFSRAERDILSDEQVENLLLEGDYPEVLNNVIVDISK